MLEQLIGSIKGYFYKKNPVTIFEKELPETIVIPSMYFPPPNILPLPHTKQGYQNNYTMNVQIFEADAQEGLKKAEEIAQSIKKNKYTIPLLNEDGSETDGSIVFNTVECQMIEFGIVQIKLEWDYIFEYD